MINIERQIIFHEHYFVEFYLKQTERVQEKIEYVFKILKTVQNIPKNFLNMSLDPLDYMKFELSLKETSFEYSAV